MNDKRNDYIENEVTLDYNAGFQSLLAGLLEKSCCEGDDCTGVNPTTSTSVPTTTSVATPPGPTTTTTAGPPTTTVATTTTTLPPGLCLNDEYGFAEALDKSLLFYEAQRSGPLPLSDMRINWRKDSALDDKGDNNEDLTGGYYDGKKIIIYVLMFF